MYTDEFQPIQPLVCIVLVISCCNRLAFNFSMCRGMWLHTEMEVVIVAIAQSENEADKVDEGWSISR